MLGHFAGKRDFFHEAIFNKQARVIRGMHRRELDRIGVVYQSSRDLHITGHSHSSNTPIIPSPLAVYGRNQDKGGPTDGRPCTPAESKASTTEHEGVALGVGDRTMIGRLLEELAKRKAEISSKIYNCIRLRLITSVAEVEQAAEQLSSVKVGLKDYERDLSEFLANLIPDELALLTDAPRVEDVLNNLEEMEDLGIKLSSPVHGDSAGETGFGGRSDLHKLSDGSASGPLPYAPAAGRSDVEDEGDGDSTILCSFCLERTSKGSTCCGYPLDYFCSECHISGVKGDPCEWCGGELDDCWLSFE